MSSCSQYNSDQQLTLTGVWVLLALRRDGVGTFIINIITEQLCASPCADTLGDVPDNVFFATGVLYLQLSAGKTAVDKLSAIEICCLYLLFT